ncbi:MAG TPA: rhomboid family intramembrane serine protease, partial [Chitinophagaceae bacterium]|nr:rhomboid family intramembrane serine protease [Chitinophagaceae bacterium]
MCAMNYDEKQYKKRISLGQSGNALVILVAISLVLFVSLTFIKLLYYFNHGENEGIVLYNKNVLPWFSLSADP